jgi:hypothetical protein
VNAILRPTITRVVVSTGTVAWLVNSSRGWSWPEAVTVAVVWLGPQVAAAVAGLMRRVECIATPWGTVYFQKADQPPEARA